MFIEYLPIILSALLTLAIGMYAWRYSQAPGIRAYVYVTAAELSWVVGYLLEISSRGLAVKLFWDDFQFIGSMFTPFFLLIFAHEYTGHEKSLTRPVRFLLTAIPILFLVLLYTNPLHGMVRTPTARIVPGKPFDVLLYDFTPLMWVSFLYSYLTYIAATILFIRNLFRQHRLFRTQTLIIITGFVFPFLGSIPGMLGIIILGQRDIAPYTFGIANLMYAWGLFRYGLFEITPIARDAVMEFMNDGVMVLDVHCKVVDLNPAALSRLEMAANQAIGKSIPQLIPGCPDLIGLFQHDEPIKQDVVYTSVSGREYVLDAYISPLRDQHQRIIGRLLVARDITEERKMGNELRRAYDELELRVKQRTADLEKANCELEQKNAELERFTYTVSHDLKSPLVTISGYLGYLKGDIASGNLERLESDTRRIAGAVDRMHILLKDLLELSRVGRMVNPSQMIPFHDLVDDAMAIVHGRLEGGGITVHTQLNLPTVNGDKPRLVEVMQNLLDNAAKFMGDQSDPRIEIGMDGQEDGKAVFFVSDNGKGIAPEYHEQIFGLFNRLDPRIEGTGVGLALVRRIIEFHGGRIWVESALGQGSTFYFTL